MLKRTFQPRGAQVISAGRSRGLMASARLAPVVVLSAFAFVAGLGLAPVARAGQTVTVPSSVVQVNQERPSPGGIYCGTDVFLQFSDVPGVLSYHGVVGDTYYGSQTFDGPPGFYDSTGYYTNLPAPGGTHRFFLTGGSRVSADPCSFTDATGRFSNPVVTGRVPAVSVSDAGVVTEPDTGSTMASFQVSLSEASTQPVSVDYATRDGAQPDGATSGEGDYTTTRGSLTFAPGETSKTVSVPVNATGTSENPESFSVGLANPQGAAIGTATGTARIMTTLGPGVSVSNAVVGEPASGSTTTTVRVSLSKPSTKPVSVDYATQDGAQPDGATVAEGDYTPTSGTVTFAPGETAKTVTLTVNGTGVKENSEGFSVELSHVQGASIANGSGTVLISTRPLLFGTVATRAGDGVPGVPVVVQGASGSQTATTDASGRYSIAVDPGDYTVTAQPADGRYVPQASQASGGCVAQGSSCSVTARSGNVQASFVSALAVDSVSFRQRSVKDSSLVGVPASGTYDGNTVEVDATISNTAASPQTTSIAFTDANSGRRLPAAGAASGSVTVPANATKAVSFEWNTSGAAWKAVGNSDANHTVRVTLALGSAKKDEPIIVRPKPLILVHGVLSDASTWNSYLGPGGFPAKANSHWQAFAVGDGQAPGVMSTNAFSPHANTIFQNAVEEKRYIAGVRASTGAWHVDIVAHSMGGLMSRQYINSMMPPNTPDGKPPVSHLVMLGTPNLGSPCADLGVAALAAGSITYNHFNPTDTSSIGPPALQLEPSFLKVFNSQVTETRGVPFSILAGDALPTICGLSGHSDLVVPIPSALWTIGDHRVDRGLYHTSMTSSPAVFSTWVSPHLELGPGASAARATTSSARPQASAARRRAHPPRPRRKPVCTQQSGTVGSITAAGVLFGSPNGRAAVIRVSRSARLALTVLTAPTAGVALRDPSGRIVRRSPPGSRQTGAFLRTLLVSHPRVGRWRLFVTSTKSRSAEAAYTAVETNPAVRLRATLTTTKSSRALLRATLSRSGRPVRGARLSAVVLLSNGTRRRVRLAAVHGSPGRYQAQTSLRLPTTTSGAQTQVYLTARDAGYQTSTFLTYAIRCPNGR